MAEVLSGHNEYGSMVIAGLVALVDADGVEKETTAWFGFSKS